MCLSAVASGELFARYVVHWEMVHVGLDEFECLILNHLNGCGRQRNGKFLDLLAGQTLAVTCHLERLANELLDVFESLDSLTHAEAEVAEPLVVECDCPVFGEELDHVGNDSFLVALGQLVEVALVQADKRPKRLEDHLFMAHVRHGVNQADRVEGELDEVADASECVQVVADQLTAVLHFLLARLMNHRVRRLDVVVDDVVGENTTLSLGQEEERELVVLVLVVEAGLRVVNVKDTSGEARSHLSPVVTVHA